MTEGFIHIEKENKFFQKAKRLINSEENHINVKLFEPLNIKYRLMQNAYLECFDEWQTKTADEVQRYEYARGGATLHRGFYSPSMMDLVTDGLNRGRLLRKMPRKRNNTYTYFFDKHSQLIRVDKFDEIAGRLESIEFLEHKSNVVQSFTYDIWGVPRLHFLSECVYDSEQKLIRYETALCGNSGEDLCSTINVEISNYSADGLVNELIWCRYTPEIPLVSGSKYTFSRNEEGYFSTYTVAQMFHGNRSLENGPHAVLVKRK